MSATEVHKSTGVSLKLDAGKTATGRDKVISVSLGKVRQAATAAGIWRVSEKLAPCLDYPVDSVERTDVCTIEDDGD